MITLDTEQKVILHAQPLSEAGNPSGIDGAITWQVNDPALVTLTPNGFDCEVVTNGPLGTAVITASADSDLGTEVVLIEGTITIQVSQAPATDILITNDDPEPK